MDSPCVFVRPRSPRQEAERLGAVRVDYFKSMPDLDVGGAVFVSTNDLNLVARASCAPCGSVGEIGAALRTLALHETTHVVFRPDEGHLILCRTGLDGPHSLVAVELETCRRIESIDLERRIWRFHELFTQTPGGYLLPWLGSPAERVPVQELERRISGLLCFFLNAMLPGDYVSTEHYVPHGRIDVRVAADMMVPSVGACALELKVLRSRRPSGRGLQYTAVSANEMVRHAEDGVAQAVDYRGQIGAGLAYLCCFDARFDDEDQPTVVTLASQQDVRLRRYFMYDSPETYRRGVVEAQAAGRLLPSQVD